MRKLILSVNTSIDGFISGPNGELDWHFAHFGEELGKFVFAQLGTMDTIVAGRVTYQSMFNHFSTLNDDFANMMNGYAKIVLSTTLTTAEWNNSRILKDHIEEEIGQLKEQPGKDIITWGGARTINTLVRHNLIDEYRIFTAPVVLGKGVPLFADVPARIELEHLSSKAFDKGVILNTYAKQK